MKRLMHRLFMVSTALLTVTLSSVFVLSAIGSAEVPSTVDVYQSTGKAATIHLIGGSSAFPNFNGGPASNQGAIDNRYPQANVSQDSAPSSQASGSTADYGPLVAFSLTQPPPQPVCDNAPAGVLPSPCPAAIPYGAHQPPPNWYALAQYPTPPGKPDASFSLLTGGQAGANNTATPPCTFGSNSTLDCSVVKARELLADANSSYTAGVASPIQAATADSHTKVNPDGSIVTTAHSHLGSIDFGGGQLVIKNLDVYAEVTSFGGKAIPKAVITIGSISSGGQALTLTDQGTTIPPPVPPPPPTGPVPGVPNGGKLVVPPPGLGGSFVGEVIKVASVKPVLTKDGPTGTVFAQGVSVRVSTPEIPGYPGNFVQYILGDTFVQAYGVPSVPFGSDNSLTSDLTNTGDLGGGLPAFSLSAGGEGYTGAPGSTLPSGNGISSGKAKRGAAALMTAFTRPPIAAMFFIWEAMVFGAALALYLARRQRRQDDLA